MTDLYLVRLTERGADLARAGLRMLAPLCTDPGRAEVEQLVAKLDQARPMGDAPRHLHAWAPWTDPGGITVQRCGCGATWLAADEQVAT